LVIRDAVESGHFLLRLGREFSMDELQRLLSKDGYGAQAKNLKELGEALEAAGVSKVRKSANGSKRRLYRLPEGVEAKEAVQNPYGL
jgi:hypothetical protein